MKTKRGSFYYICVGNNYYAGTRPIMTTIKVKEPRDWTDKEKAKPRYRRVNRQGYGHYQVPNARGKNGIYRWGDRETVIKTPMKDVIKEVPSSEYVEDWTQDFAKAKKFRIESKALAKAEELAKSNSMDKIRPRVLLHEGDRNVRAGTKG